MKSFAAAVVSSVASAAGVLLATLAPSFASASAYPPNYVADSVCQVQEGVRACASNQHVGSFPRLSLRYEGPLLATQWGRISARVTFNGRTGVFKMSNANYAEYLTLGDIRNLTQCVDASSPSVGNPYPACVSRGSSWNYDLPSPNELDLMFYARSDRGVGNAWDVSVSFEAQDGSNNPKVTTFRFE